MVVTMVEGSVAPERDADLLAAWNDSSGSPPAGLLESFLVRSDGDLWRILTVWESREALTAMRAAGRPAALEMFDRAGSHGSVSIWSVEGRITPGRH